VTTDTDTKTYLSEKQLARVEALKAISGYAREVKIMSGSRAEPSDLIRLSEYVLNGTIDATYQEERHDRSDP
jgi:hypothetical protein